MTHQTFAARLTRQPLPHDLVAGVEAAAQFADLGPELAGLLAGTAGCSPYLRSLMQREHEWLRPVLSGTPEQAVQETLAALDHVPTEGLASQLRQAKRRVALVAALADLGGVWPLEAVTGALSALADRAVDLSLRHLVAEEIRRGKLPGATLDDAETAGGMVALAMGKLGAGELNYSSDIDLICLYDDTRFTAADNPEARASFVRVTRRMTALLSDLTGEGYVFRTDLRLRPDASVTPVCLSMSAAEAYYESVGRTWERAAYIKARPAGGDLAAGARFLQTLAPFVWRKHLDFAAIQDAHDMRLRIRDHKGLHGPIVLEGHNMKLGKGGIRDIEFFTQTRQLIAGGRDPDLRARQTVVGLGALATKGWIPQDVTDDLAALYRSHRLVEHRLQMINDAQTHNLPNNSEGFDRLARLMGIGDTAQLRGDLTAQLTRTANQTEGFFAPGPCGDGADDKAPVLSETARSIVEGWRAYPALRSDRAIEIFRRLRPRLLERLGRAANPDAGLMQFDNFLRGLPAGVQVFSLFEANPHLIDLIVDIATTAPNLAGYLGRNSAVLDAVIGGAFFDPWPGVGALSGVFAAAMASQSDYEQKLDAARRVMREWHFRIGVHHLRGLIDAFEAARHYADLAEAVLAALWPVCSVEFARKHGPAPGRGAVVLAMGSLGAQRLNAGSDLDLIVIYDPQGVDASDGPRPLASRPYYARLTQAFVTALTAPMASGRLYEVDMRLRPSGRQGPVATSLASFASYQRDEAWTWEHLALTRARVVAGAPGLGAEVETLRRALLHEKGVGAQILADVAEMRARIRHAKPNRSVWEVKLGPGRMQDIELMAQTTALIAADASRGVERQLFAGRKAGFLSEAQESVLLAAYRLCWRVQCPAHLLAETTLDPETIGQGGAEFVLRETEMSDLDTLLVELDTRAAAAAAIIEQLISANSPQNFTQPEVTP